MSTAVATPALTTERPIESRGYATKAGASRAAKQIDRAWLTRHFGVAREELVIRVRPNAEWARSGIDKAEFVIAAAAHNFAPTCVDCLVA